MIDVFTLECYEYSYYKICSRTPFQANITDMFIRFLEFQVYTASDEYPHSFVRTPKIVCSNIIHFSNF